MKALTIERPPIVEKRSLVPWLFVIFFGLLFVWLYQNNVGFALGVLVSASIVVAAIESAYAGMYWCTAGFAALAMVFNPYTHFLNPLDAAIAALAMVGLSPMLLLFVCRKSGAYINALPDGSRWWLPLARTVVELVE